MNGPMTSATNYALLANRLQALGMLECPDRPTLTGIVRGMENSLLEEWLEKEWSDGKDVPLMINFHLREEGR